MENYLLHLLILIGTYSILAYSLNLVTGFGGLIAFCHAAFYGIGAYAFTLLSIGGETHRLADEVLYSADLSFLLALPAAPLVAGLFAFIIGWIALRFRSDLFIFATLGFQMIVFVVLHNWIALSRGPFGIYGIPRPELFGWRINELWEYALLIGALNAIVLPLLFILYRSPFGLALQALRDNERAAESLGISAKRHHLAAFTVAGACAGLAGAFYAGYVTYIDPSSFGLMETIFIVSLLLLGGSGNRVGPILGAVVMILLPEILRFVGLPSSVAANMREIIYGLILILLMYFRPQGLAGSYEVK